LIESLERGFSRRFASAAVPADPKRITGLVEASIVRVEIKIELSASPGRSHAHGPRLVRPSLGRGQPPLHRPEVNGIELPLDLATIHSHVRLLICTKARACER
jgi:hypothetical protein